MYIKRIIDGKEYTFDLTDGELYEAGLRHSELCHHADIDNVFDSIKNDLTPEAAEYIETHLGEAYIDYENRINNDETWWHMCKDALENVWHKHLRDARKERIEA